jgi:ATP-dependent Clp protease adaptor protein ClpS
VRSSGVVTAIPDELVEVEGVLETDRPWVTIVWNDPINLMDYVLHVFMTHFGYSKEKAQELMLQVHNEGRSAVSNGDRESMERDVQAMHGFGLWATLAKDD